MSEQKLTKKQNIIQVIKFALFSASAGIIQLVSFTLLFEAAGLNNTVSYIISLALSVLWNFTFNRKFTFKSAANVPVAMLKVALFYCVFAKIEGKQNAFHVFPRIYEHTAIIVRAVFFAIFVAQFLGRDYVRHSVNFT